MTCRSGILLLWLVGSSCLLVPPGNGAEPDPSVADQQILRAAKISVDDPSLLEFFRKHTLTPANRERIQALIRQLGDKSFEVRKRASAELAARGIVVWRLLQQAREERDIEIVRRAEQCLRTIEKGEAAEI